MMPLKIAIADEHAIIRRGINAMLMDSYPAVADIAASLTLAFTGEAATTADLLALLTQHTPDILFLGRTLTAPQSQNPLNNMDGLALVKWLNHHYPTLKVMVLSSDKNPLLIRLTLEAGASAWLSRHADEKTLNQALKAVVQDEIYVEHSLMSALFHGGKMPRETLSLREHEVLRYICRGLSLTDIARRMHLSIKTVSAHKLRAMEKLGVNNTCQLYSLLVSTRMFDIAI
ncbi:response regulator transcription factor [Leclercia adecarboxylata]|uniref:response regulator transcription factor n=1 Tax=Leclercia adecarboxylata TaxID=83655 RepID=UPI002DB86AA7|nr:response regulator transcription factor [Leclercia adecarboxylata]MEB6380868.1 response regulator transcription factor [Leclercia adecarboxylata]